jgi:hypothetical protein
MRDAACQITDAFYHDIRAHHATGHAGENAANDGVLHKRLGRYRREKTTHD